MSPTHPNPPNRRSVAPLVIGAFVGVVAAVFLAAGAALFWGQSEKDADGYLTTGSDRYATATNALTTEDLDIGDSGTGWIVDRDAYGKIRLQVSPGGDKPVFVGIAPTEDVRAYLAGTAHSTVTDIDYSPFRADYRDVRGERPAAPAAQDIWAASAQGAGTQTVTWDVESGAWSVVVMNADGSAGIDTGISAGANVPILDDLAWGATATGVLLLGGALVLLVLGARGRPPRPQAPAYQAVVPA